MTAYRIYTVDSDGHVIAPPCIIECADDQEALRQARCRLNSKPVEVWEGGTCVAKLKPTP